MSIVPPVRPSPRPLILATHRPHAAASGATTSVVVSATPPVECLSTGTPRTCDRSITRPECAMASVSAIVSASDMPRRHTAMSHADIW